MPSLDRATARGAKASYLLTLAYQHDGQYQNALSEATLLLAALSVAAPEPSHVPDVQASTSVPPTIAEKVAALLPSLTELVRQDQLLTTQAQGARDPALRLLYRGRLAEFRNHPGWAARLYQMAEEALPHDPTATELISLAVERQYLTSVGRRPPSVGPVDLYPLVLRLLQHPKLSAERRRLGVAAAQTLLGQPPVQPSDGLLNEYAQQAARDLEDQVPPWQPGRQGGFITCVFRDPQGYIWVATEDKGIWCSEPHVPDSSQWKQYAAGSGLGDNTCYALACDQSGRLWAGTLNHGVSVYSGGSWRNYGLLDGPGGSRIFALAVSPSGDVWGATENGLFRYSHNAWAHYTRADGLPSDQANALAFDRRGTLFVGTSSDGIAIGSADDDYRKFRIVTGPAHAPDRGHGSGLPSRMINCLLVSRKTGTVYAGTPAGLAQSEDGGKTWRFRRGADWLDKIRDEAGAGLADFAKINGIEVMPLPEGRQTPADQPFAIAAGSASERFLASRGFTGGEAGQNQDTVSVKGVRHAAPAAVYQAERRGNFLFRASHLQPRGRYLLRLHFAETFYGGSGKRVFNVFLNGQPSLQRFDIFAEAGGKDRAVVKEFVVRASDLGQITAHFQGVYWPAQSEEDTNQQREAADLLEDYVTCISEDGAGHLLVGHRLQGVEELDQATGRRLSASPQERPVADYVASVLTLPGGTLLIGGYGGGLTRYMTPGTAPDVLPEDVPKNNPSVPSQKFPTPAGVPSLADLNSMVKAVSLVAPAGDEMKAHVVSLDDDWLTEGDWLGRYGHYWACLCAVLSPQNYVWGAGWQPVRYASRIGPNAAAGDTLRYWIQWLYSDDPRVLQLPPIYLDSRVRIGLVKSSKGRREAELDDHGEAYPMSKDGPHIYYTVTVPRGLYYLSLYNFNRTGHDGVDRLRDYQISVRPHSSGTALNDIKDFGKQPELARGRVKDFWGGVWKRFLVRGPIDLTVQMDRNNSYNTILPAVMLDLVDETPPPYFRTVSEWKATQAQQEERWERAVQAQSRGEKHNPLTLCASETQAAERLFDLLTTTRLINSTWWAINGRSYYSALGKWYAAQTRQTKQMPSAPRLHLNARLATCYYQTGLYALWEQNQKMLGLTPAREVEQALRWDGITDAEQDYQAVTDYVALRRKNRGGMSAARTR